VSERAAWQSLAAVVTFAASVTLPIAVVGGVPVYLIDQGSTARLGLWVVGLAVLFGLRPAGASGGVEALTIAATVSAYLVVMIFPAVTGHASIGFWMLLLTAWLMAWLLVTRLSYLRPANPTWAWIVRLAVPVLFGASLLFLWEAVVRGANIEQVILPAPSVIAQRLAASLYVLWADFRQTFLKSVLAGFAIGSGSGFLAAIVADRIPFLKRGLLPVGNLASALPIIGIAPILVTWFGFDWQSKAAVVAVMTFFPMLVNAVAGLAAADVMERDLMRTYAANYWQGLFKLRLPAALPFIFNALKINSTLAMIGAIVAEFFGTPIVGMGFRISTEVGRMNIDMVWAEIAVAALAGSAFYGLVTLVERAATFWHPSIRQS